MKLLPALLLALPIAAHAETFFQAEAGLSSTTTHGDGTWYQLGVPHSLKVNTLAIGAGVGYRQHFGSRWDLITLLDYTYMGEQSASCLCVIDAQYNTGTHHASVAGYIPFNGHGHVQGIALTFGPGYTWHGIRFGVEAGPWLFWSTWHVTHNDPAQPGSYDLSHVTKAQVRFVAGASIGYKDFSLRYRYYNESTSGGSNPPLQTGAHVVQLVYSRGF